MKLEGKVAIVTGAGRGLGRGIALCLAEEGVDVVVNSLHEETTNKTAADVKALGRKSLAIVADITESEQIARVVQETLNTFGKIDILVNNVGGRGKPKEVGTGALAQAEAEWDATYEQNLRPTALMCTAVAPHFIKQKGGKIVNISSIAGRYPFLFPIPNANAYGAMKTAIIMFTQSLANDLGPHNINVNCICPGIIYTDAWKGLAKRAVETMPKYKGMDPREWFVAMMEEKYPELGYFTPLKREQTPEDIGHAVVFFVSEDAKNITGQTLNVDSGLAKN